MTSELLIKMYDNWDLYLHEKQSLYIGSCYAQAKRIGLNKIINMNVPEIKEFYTKILPEWDTTIKELFQHDLSHMLSSGNSLRQLKWNFIPMYERIRKFYGIEFMPQNISGDYTNYTNKRLRPELLNEIRDVIKYKMLKIC